MRRNNKTLYEQIMRNVSKEIQKSLYESQETNSLQEDVENYLYNFSMECGFDYEEIKSKINAMRIEDILKEAGYGSTAKEKNLFKTQLYKLIANEKTFKQFIERKGKEVSDFWEKTAEEDRIRVNAHRDKKKAAVQKLLQEIVDLGVKVKIDGDWGGKWHDLTIDDNGNIRLIRSGYNYDNI